MFSRGIRASARSCYVFCYVLCSLICLGAHLSSLNLSRPCFHTIRLILQPPKFMHSSRLCLCLSLLSCNIRGSWYSICLFLSHRFFGRDMHLMIVLHSATSSFHPLGLSSWLFFSTKLPTMLINCRRVWLKTPKPYLLFMRKWLSNRQ